MNHHVPFSILLIAAATVTVSAQAEQPTCAANYHSDGKSAETFVVTSLNPETVIDRLPFRLAKAGVTIDWTDSKKGLIKAQTLDVHAERAGENTRVTFHTTDRATDAETLCKWASLVGNPPVPKAAQPAQDPALIARLKDDLLKKHVLVQPDQSQGLNNAQISSLDDFRDFVVTAARTTPGKQEYEVTMLLPRDSCGILVDDSNEATRGLMGQSSMPGRAKNASVQVRMVYEGQGASMRLVDAPILHIESAK